MMQSQHIDPGPEITERPTCLLCATRMWLTRIAPDHPEHEKRTFECPVCDYSESVVVKYK